MKFLVAASLKSLKVFCEIHPIVKCDTYEFYVRIVRKKVTIQVLPLLQIGTWRILWLLFSLDLVLFSIWHTTLPVCQGHSADIPLLNQHLMHAFIIHFILASFTCAHSAWFSTSIWCRHHNQSIPYMECDGFSSHSSIFHIPRDQGPRPFLSFGSS